MSCRLDLLPDLLPIGSAPSSTACAAGWTAVAVTALLVLWRGVPAVIGRTWRPHPDPTHLPPTGQRVADAVLSIGLLIGALGLVERDWGWQAVGFVLVVAWVLGSMAYGLRREREPGVPHTTPTLLDVEHAEHDEGQPPPLAPRQRDVPPDAD